MLCLMVRSCDADLRQCQSSYVGKMLFLLVPRVASLLWRSSVRLSCHVGDKEEGDGKWGGGSDEENGGCVCCL